MSQRPADAGVGDDRGRPARRPPSRTLPRGRPRNRRHRRRRLPAVAAAQRRQPETPPHPLAAARAAHTSPPPSAPGRPSQRPPPCSLPRPVASAGARGGASGVGVRGGGSSRLRGTRNVYPAPRWGHTAAGGACGRRAAASGGGGTHTQPPALRLWAVGLLTMAAAVQKRGGVGDGMRVGGARTASSSSGRAHPPPPPPARQPRTQAAPPCRGHNRRVGVCVWGVFYLLLKGARRRSQRSWSPPPLLARTHNGRGR